VVGGFFLYAFTHFFFINASGFSGNLMSIVEQVAPLPVIKLGSP
jgi:hypothetical protein